MIAIQMMFHPGGTVPSGTVHDEAGDLEWHSHCVPVDHGLFFMNLVPLFLSHPVRTVIIIGEHYHKPKC